MVTNYIQSSISDYVFNAIDRKKLYAIIKYEKFFKNLPYQFP